MNIKGIPDGYHTITPYFSVQGASALIEFLKQAFEAQEIERHTMPDGTIINAQIKVGDSMVLVAEAPKDLGKRRLMPAMLYMYVNDVDAVYQKAVQAGGIPIMEPIDQFYGDRSGAVEDMAGNQWWIATHIEDMSEEELTNRASKMKKTLMSICAVLLIWASFAIRVAAQKTASPSNPVTDPKVISPKTTPQSQETLKKVVAYNFIHDFADKLEARLKDKSVGYAFVINEKADGVDITEGRAGGDARRAPDVMPRKMSINDKFNIASVSKTITAAALLKLLFEQKIDIDKPMYLYLPPDWTLGSNIKTITFRELLTHRSGLRCSKEVTYDFLKECIGGGIKIEDKQKDCNGVKNGNICYNNSNFALFRMIIPRLFVPNFSVPSGETASSYYGKIYMSYVQRHVFLPIGLMNIYCKPTDLFPGQTYQFPEPIIAGTDFGDMSETNASRGWNMSAAQLSAFVSNLLYTNKIVPQTVHEQMKSDQLGLYSGTLIGNIQGYDHNGYYPGKNDQGNVFNNGELNSVIIGFSDGVSVALIVNSQLGPGLSPTLEIKAAMKEALKKAGLG